MGKLREAQHSLQWRAQAGDLEAVALLLQQLIAPTPATLEVTRHDHTLQVCLVNAPQATLESNALMVYSAVYALGITDITQLSVLAGPSPENRQRWQQTFTLSAATVPPKPTHPSLVAEATLQAADDSASIYCGEPLLASVFSLEADACQASLRLRPLPNMPWAQLWQQPWAFDGKGRPLTAVVALSFIIGVSMTQWRHQQRQSLSGGMVTSGQMTTVLPASSQTAGSAAEATDAPSAAASHSRISSLDQSVEPAARVPDTLPTITIKAVGDIIMGTDYQRYRMPDDWQYFFDGIKFHLEEADLVFGNFESTLTEVPRSAKDTSRPMTFAFRSPPWHASVLRAAGFDVLSVANNHSMDFFEQGFNDTIANIESEGMIAVGRKGDIQYTEVNGVKVAFIGFSYLSAHNTVHDLDAAGALVQAAEQNADVVIVSVHAGKEGTDALYSRNQEEFFYSENRGNLVHFSRTVVDYGADLVLGHGPHVPRAVELYNNRLIAYSLGNFLGYRTLSTQGPLGLSMVLQAKLDGDGNFVDGRIIPAALDPNGVPYLDNHFGSVSLVRHATRRDFPDTPLVIDDLGNILRQE